MCEARNCQAKGPQGLWSQTRLSTAETVSADSIQKSAALLSYVLGGAQRVALQSLSLTVAGIQ